MIDSLEDKGIDLKSSFVFKGDLHSLKSVGKSLDTYTNGSMPLVGSLSFFDGVVVDVNNFVEVFSDSLSDFM